MGTFTFHGWLLGRDLHRQRPGGHRQRCPGATVTKQLIDTYLKPLLIGADPWDTEFLWQQMYRRTMAFGRKGVGMAAISAVDIALWDFSASPRSNRSTACLVDERRHEFLSTPAVSTQFAPPELAQEAKRYKDDGYKAMKLRFGWGPTDGAAGMQRNLELVRTVRETVGDDSD